MWRRMPGTQPTCHQHLTQTYERYRAKLRLVAASSCRGCSYSGLRRRNNVSRTSERPSSTANPPSDPAIHPARSHLKRSLSTGLVNNPTASTAWPVSRSGAAASSRASCPASSRARERRGVSSACARRRRGGSGPVGTGGACAAATTGRRRSYPGHSGGTHGAGELLSRRSGAAA